MALPWSTLVKAIPWSDVIAKAPDIAQGARKLWQKVGTQESVGSAAAPTAAGDAPDARLTALTAQVAELNARQQESAELLSALANQNAELVSAIAALRQRNRLLGAATGVTAVVALAALTLALTSP
jgi:fructose-1,6-bisphosphatase/sedoheptulose 1,7-bisphosphatase-like protein